MLARHKLCDARGLLLRPSFIFVDELKNLFAPAQDLFGCLSTLFYRITIGSSEGLGYAFAQRITVTARSRSSGGRFCTFVIWGRRSTAPFDSAEIGKCCVDITAEELIHGIFV